MKLYGFPPSPNTWKVRAVAAHLGIPLELEFVDLTKGGSHTPDYLALNPDRPHADAGRRRFQALGIDRDHAVPRRARSRTRSGRTTPAPAPTSCAGRAGTLAHWSKEGFEPLVFNRLVKKLMNLGAPDEAAVAKGLECFQQGHQGARRASGEAALSRRQGVDAGGFLGRRTVVLHQGGRFAGRALSARAGVVRPRLGAAVLARNGAAARRRGGVIKSSSRGERAAPAALFHERSAGRRSAEPCRQRGVAPGSCIPL